MAITNATQFTIKKYPTKKAGIATLASVATQNAKTIKAVYDVRDFDFAIIRITNTHGSNSLDYYVDGSYWDAPDDSSPASDWHTVSDTGAVALTNIALANGVDATRIIDVSKEAFLRIQTENTTNDQNASVKVEIRAILNRSRTS